MSRSMLVGILTALLLGFAAPARAQEQPGPRGGNPEIEALRKELAECRRLIETLLEQQKALQERVKQLEARLGDLQAGPPLPIPPTPYKRPLGAEGLRRAIVDLASGDAAEAAEGAKALAAASDLEALAKDPAVARFADVRVLFRDDFAAGPGEWKESKGGRGTKDLRWAREGAVRWERSDSGADGGSVGIHRPLAQDVSPADYLIVGGRILVEGHSLENSGWCSDEKGGHGEYPVHVQITFLDDAERDAVWSHGFLANHDRSTRLTNFTQVPEGGWTTFGFDLMAPETRAPRDPARPGFELPRPAILRRILLQGNGWDFAGAADEVVLIAISAKEEALKRKPPAPPGGMEPEGELPERPGPGKPRRFAIGLSGTSGPSGHAKQCLDSTAMLFSTLTETYGYSPQAVYCLYEDPKASEEIDGQANFVNSAGFAEAFIQALDQNLNDADKDGRASFKEAYDYTLGRVRDWYRQKNLPDILEHALLDDDGNGEGHFGEGVVEGDGAFAAGVFLGDGGRKLEPDREFEKWLEECNRTLKLDFVCRE